MTNLSLLKVQSELIKLVLYKSAAVYNDVGRQGNKTTKNQQKKSADGADVKYKQR